MKHGRISIAMILALAAWVFIAPPASAQKIRQVTEQEKAETGANWVYEVAFGDFTSTATNTAQTLTMNIVAKQGVTLVAMTLPTAFDTSSGSMWTSSCAVTVGDGTDADLYLTSTELASDGTEVFLKYGRTVWSSGAATDDVTFAYSPKVYTGSDTIDFAFTPDNTEMLSSNTSGKVRFWFNIWDATKR
jgi:hypothetical protein